MSQNFEFDTIFPREDCGAIKWAIARNSRGARPEGAVPLSIADMEFKSPPAVRQALKELADFGMWGYSRPTDECKRAVTGWFQRRHGWAIDPEWIVQSNNVVSAIGGAVRAFTRPGDKIIIQTPVYHPFYQAVTGNGRTLVENPLIREGMDYRMDLEDLAEKAKGAKLLILCSPHNPVGRVWSREELEGLAGICLENGVLVVSDEIHCDLVHNGHRHIPFASLGEEHARNSVICTSASKSFSFAGLACANIIIPNEALREKFRAQMDRDGFGAQSIFGLKAMETAYRDCDDWFDAMLAYVWDNYLCLKEFLKAHFPKAGISDLQGTYLAWVDLSGLGLTADELQTFLTDEASLFLNDGRKFGEKTCAGFVRVNLACPRRALTEGLDRLLAAAKQRGLA